MPRHEATQAGSGADPGRNRKLVVFFTRGMSFEGWLRAGILERELAIYRELADVVDRLTFVTYGGPSDREFANVLPGAEVLPNAWGLPPNLYSVIAPWLHRSSLHDASVFRTNQINGAWCGVVAKLLFRKPLVVRCGYLWADLARHGGRRWRHLVAGIIEQFVLRFADRIVVAADADAARAVEQYGVDRGRVRVVPNFVSTCVFRPMADVATEKGRVVFVGRLEPEKNVDLLLDALRGAPSLKLTVVGDGSLRDALEAKARAYGLSVEFLGKLPHRDLPVVLNRAEVFVLPSRYEGSPKALLEAMACGVPVVGTRVPGIRDIVRHRENGLLCAAVPEDIRAALLEVTADPALRQQLRDAGKRFVHERCSIGVVAGLERALLASLPAE
jgi:glycosyltransferase involved in cell wall biosynthesis